MLEAVEGNIHQRLCALLDEHRARYRVMAHEAVSAKPSRQSAAPRLARARKR